MNDYSMLDCYLSEILLCKGEIVLLW